MKAPERAWVDAYGVPPVGFAPIELTPARHVMARRALRSLRRDYRKARLAGTDTRWITQLAASIEQADFELRWVELMFALPTSLRLAT